MVRDAHSAASSCWDLHPLPAVWLLPYSTSFLSLLKSVLLRWVATKSTWRPKKNKCNLLQLKELNITDIWEALPPSSVPGWFYFLEFHINHSLVLSIASHFSWFSIFLLLWEPNAQMFPEAQWIVYSTNIIGEFSSCRNSPIRLSDQSCSWSAHFTTKCLRLWDDTTDCDH